MDVCLFMQCFTIRNQEWGINKCKWMLKLLKCCSPTCPLPQDHYTCLANSCKYVILLQSIHRGTLSTLEESLISVPPPRLFSFKNFSNSPPLPPPLSSLLSFLLWVSNFGTLLLLSLLLFNGKIMTLSKFPPPSPLIQILLYLFDFT